VLADVGLDQVEALLVGHGHLWKNLNTFGRICQ
jgi:hypothetical protein